MLAITLWEGFETIILPRSITRGFRLTRFFYLTLWTTVRSIAVRTRSENIRETLLNCFGPGSLIILLQFWALLLIMSFGTFQFGYAIGNPHALPTTYSMQLYLSGVTFFTLGYGDITPSTPFGKFVAVVEAGTGFGFLAIVIGYLPVIYQSFSRREQAISLLDARAGSPPTAAELVRRYAQANSLDSLSILLREWEAWTADVLESHLSYPVLAFYRSQHDRQSWLAALTAILDTCSVVMVGIEGGPTWQARLTFAMARHAVVDLCMAFKMPPMPLESSRLPPDMMDELRAVLMEANVAFCETSGAEQELYELRKSYEPYVNALSHRFLLDLPPWVQEDPLPDDWQSSSQELGHVT